MNEKTYFEVKPQGKLLGYWIIVTSIAFIVGLLSLLVPFLVTKDILQGVVGFITTIVAIVFALSVLYEYFLYKTYSYKATDKGVYFEGGLLVKRQKFAPMYKLTNLEKTQDIFEQMLGIYKLQFHTAGTGTPIAEIRFQGLADVETPRKIIQELIEKSKKYSRSDE